MLHRQLATGSTAVGAASAVAHLTPAGLRVSEMVTFSMPWALFEWRLSSIALIIWADIAEVIVRDTLRGETQANGVQDITISTSRDPKMAVRYISVTRILFADFNLQLG